MNKPLERKILQRIRKTTLEQHANMIIKRDGVRGILIDNVFIPWVTLSDKIRELLTLAALHPSADKEYTGPCFLFSDEKSPKEKLAATLENLGTPKFPTWGKTMAEVKENDPPLDCISAVVSGWVPKHLPAEREAFVVLVVNHANNPIHAEYFSVGTQEQTAVYPREVAKLILKYSGTGAMVIHNHPSGSVSPSAADRAITRDLNNALKALEIRFLDHIIIGKSENGRNYYSFRENGILV